MQRLHFICSVYIHIHNAASLPLFTPVHRQNAKLDIFRCGTLNQTCLRHSVTAPTFAEAVFFVTCMGAPMRPMRLCAPCAGSFRMVIPST